MRTVITGGAGFVGSHLCERFLAEGHEVVCVDNCITGTLANIEHLRPNDRFTFIRHDISHPLEIDGPVDNVLHFASPASPVDYLRAPHPDAQGRLAGHAQHAGPGQAEEGSLPAGQHQRGLRRSRAAPAARRLLGPRQPHRRARRLRRGQALRRGHDDGLSPLSRRQYAHMRIFNTYGPRMRLDDGRVLPNFMGQALRGEPLTVYGDGSQTRSFCYVDDLVEGIFRLLFTDFHEPVNLGNPDEVTILEFATGNPGALGQQQLHRLQAAAAGRPARAPPGHQPGEEALELGASNQPARGIAAYADALSPKGGATWLQAIAPFSPLVLLGGGFSLFACSRSLLSLCR